MGGQAGPRRHRLSLRPVPRRRFSQVQWVEVLRRGKTFYRLAELGRLSGLSFAAARRAVARLTERGLLSRVGKGIYANRLGPGGPPTIEMAVALLYPPAYVSLASGLFLHGVADQAPHLLTCVTTNKTKRFETGLGEVHYHHVKPELFFGYELRDGVPLGLPEKVALDFIYLELQNGRRPALDEWNWESLDVPRLRELGEAYPRTVRSLLSQFAPATGAHQ